MGIPFYHPKPQPPTGRDQEVIPQANAGWWSSLFFSWMNPLLITGYTRPLQEDDIWRMDEGRLTSHLSEELEKNFFARCPPSIRPDTFEGGKRSMAAQTNWVGEGHEAGSIDEKDGKLHGSDSSLSEDKTRTNTRVASPDMSEKVDMQEPTTGELAYPPKQDLDGVQTMEREEAEQEELQGLNGEYNIGVDMPVIERSISLAQQNSRVQRTTLATGTKLPGSTKVQGKALEDHSWLSRKLPFTGYSKAVMVAEGRHVLEDDGTGKIRRYDQSLTMALALTMKKRMLLALICKAISSVILQVSSLVTKQLILWITTKHAYSVLTAAEQAVTSAPSGIGRGIGLAIGLTAMQEIASLCNNHFFAHSMGCGWMMRACLIDQISRKSLRLSPASRLEFTNGRLTTSVSGDCSFLDFASPMSIEVIVEPFTILIGMALLLYYLGYSALVGIAVLIASTPLMAFLFRGLIASRYKQMAIVDLRVRMISEVLNAIRQIKLYAYEAYFGQKILNYREQEITRLRINVRHRAVMVSTMTFLPVAAAVLTFITYGLSGHTLDAATIFAALQVFSLISGPLRILPMAFTAVSDAHVAIVRISTCLLADELPRDIQIDSSLDVAVRAQGDFTFETAGVPKLDAKGGRKMRDRKAEKAANIEREKHIRAVRARRRKGLAEAETKEDAVVEDDDEKPFMLTGIDIAIPRGALVVVVGRIGSGKSALLQALIGEMRQTKGKVNFGGSLSYVAQQPWVMNASVQENIVFGSNKMDQQRLADTLYACSLTRDLEQLSDGLDTEIGERGINLSGGQKARVALARAVYFNADITIMDDVLAAVDAHVSAHLIENCILNPDALGSKTRILVTHHLEATPHADIILVVENGRIVQQGSYQDLKSAQGIFKTMLDDFGNEEQEEEDPDAERAVKEVNTIAKKKDGPVFKLLMDEERNTGSVSWAVYGSFLKAMGSVWRPLFSLLCLCLAQVSQVGNTLFLGFWSGSEISGFRQGDYMAIYAALGFTLAIFTFAGSLSLSLAGLRASLFLFRRALNGVLRSPILYHDSTPIGRIVSRLSKDIEMIDDRLTMQIFQLFSQLLSVFGTLALVLYSYALLGVVFIPIIIVYVVLAGYYRQTSREIKRIDSNQRSFIYTSFGEQLVGLASIRAYRQQQHFRTKLQNAVDVECRAYALTIYCQRWLGIRLDALGNLLILGICLFGVGYADSVSPTKLGVVLTYGLTATQAFSQIVNFYAQVEQEMNNVERVTYTGNLPLEAAPVLPNDPPREWPQKGVVKFDNVQMRYREALPLVLKGLTFEAIAGEKIGIVGRTGAGKSSLAQVLFRIVELAGGEIEIDGVDLSKVGLDTLRTRLSIIPQEALLFSGTVRDNLDPTGIYGDADLNEALKKCDLLPGPDADAIFVERCKKFQLDSHVADEGGNFSAGERQLLALARAVAKKSRVTILDEATSSVDPATDQSIQLTIRNHMNDTTLLCIAHRLATIAFYDRILVMDHGVIAELDAPLVLYDKEDSIFRGMCEAASLSREQIVRIRAGEIITVVEKDADATVSAGGVVVA